MCGINGLVSSKFSRGEGETIVKKMNITLAHRGPDNDGVWCGDEVFLGHRRLSIIDLNPESNQPFVTPDQRFVIVYNGELYNYRELKLELQRASQGSGEVPYFFRTASDTEVVLAAYLRWGSKCLLHFNGMFAFAIYDTLEKQMFIARDRLGVKPLYYYFGDEGFIFSSEIRPIIHSGVKPFALNSSVLAEYAMYQTVMMPSTIIKGVYSLMPGHYMEWREGKVSQVKYYDPNLYKPLPDDMSYGEVCSKIYGLLSLSVQRRLVADVPFGAFLSGGIDSSAVVGLMSRVSNTRVKTFTVTFDENDFSEAQYAAIIAKRFNTEHHEIKLSPAHFLEELPGALTAMDHPGGDGPNTYLVSKATKKAGITMALSGIGGDELFAGYPVFKRMHRLNQKAWINMVPVLARRGIGYAVKLKNKTISGNKIQELLGQENINFNTAYTLSRSAFTLRELNRLMPGAEPYSGLREIVSAVPQFENHLLSSVSLAEIQSYLLNTLLRDTDQMAMAVALEVREPFLDHQLLEFVLGVKDNYKFPHSAKKLLTDSLGDLLPPDIINRPKMGFTLPWQYWLKNELNSFCEKNLHALGSRGHFKQNELRGLWQKFLSGDPGVSWSRVWHLVVLNSWLEQNKITN